MGTHAAPRARSAWRPAALAAVAGLALVSAGTGVYALLQATATGTQTAGTGTLSLTLAANGTFGTAIADAAPGDTYHRYVTLTNGGTLAAAGLTVAAAATGSADLTGTGASALLVSVSTCSVAWTTTGTGSCSGTSATPVNAVPLGSLGAARDVVATAVSAGTPHRLRLTLVVPDLGEVTTTARRRPRRCRAARRASRSRSARPSARPP